MANAVRRRIKPAGWVVLLLLAAGAGYAAYRVFDLGQVFGPAVRRWLSAAESAGETPDGGLSSNAGSSTTVGVAPTVDAGAAASPVAGPDGGAEVGDAGGAPIAPQVIVSRRLFPPVPPELPPPAQAMPGLALPPLVGNIAPEGAAHVGSEAAAIASVVDGQSAATVVSVAALAAHPEALAHGARAVWLFGFRPQDGGVIPSCDPPSLAKTKLGVVRGSLAHFEILAAFAGDPLPALTTFDGESELAAAVADGSVTGGEAPLAVRAGAGQCGALPASASAFVIVMSRDRPMSAPALSSVTRLEKAPPSRAEVGAFFQSGTTGIETFDGLFKAASGAWSEVALIPAAPAASAAIDRRFLEPATPVHVTSGESAAAPAGSPVKEPVDGGTAAPPTRSGLGYPSWLDEE